MEYKLLISYPFLFISKWNRLTNKVFYNQLVSYTWWSTSSRIVCWCRTRKNDFWRRDFFICILSAAVWL